MLAQGLCNGAAAADQIEQDSQYTCHLTVSELRSRYIPLGSTYQQREPCLQGLSLSLLRLDEPRWLHLLDAPAQVLTASFYCSYAIPAVQKQMWVPPRSKPASRLLSATSLCRSEACRLQLNVNCLAGRSCLKLPSLQVALVMSAHAGWQTCLRP